MSWANQYVGGSWAVNFNCWDWFRYWQFTEFARTVPRLAINQDADGIRLGLKNWVKTKTPKNGDAVRMLDSEGHFHVGIYTDADCVLHAVRGMGVCHDELWQLKLIGMQLRGFYTWQDS